ncbi:MAG TPA: tetratricopeptide repeat protein, partial [Chitinophagaceae bacterium]|nr:tetratricopeptide repeat protein [Chitinophagaceae bacterium]
KTLHENKDALSRFNNKLAVMLSDRGQEIINHYLEGDEAELERRRYYNSKSNGYDVYPQMFGVALKLTQPENYLYQILQVKLHYFTGVAARLKISAVEDPTALIDTAMAEQKRAFQLEENAAYIQNELGVLYLLKNEPAVAEKYFIRATQIAPQWAIPWSNLAGLYTGTKKYDKAITASKTAVSLQPDFQGAFISSGVIYEKKGNLLQAEELFRKSIQINSRHYLPFERLGYVYMNTTQYERADSFFYEADKRKKGYHFTDNQMLYVEPASSFVLGPMVKCPFDSADVDKEDVMGHFIWGIRAYENGNLKNAEKKFKEVIALDKTNPLVFHYLGRLLYEQKRWEEAAIIFDYAVAWYLTDTAFIHYCDSLTRKLRFTKSKECISQEFQASAYSRTDDHYFSGRMYELWNHFGEAETHYRKIIAMDTFFIGGYYLLWNMLEKMGRFKDAEDVLHSYTATAKITGNQELNSFYKRMISRYPDRGDWYYKAGLLLYYLSSNDPETYQFDKKKITQDSLIEKYIISKGDATKPEIRASSEDMANLPGILEPVIFSDRIIYPRTEGIAYLKMADSLLEPDENALADINYKIGDLYVWQGLPEKAPPYYKKSVDLKPDNANARLKLIDIYDTIYQFTNAMAQLDSLNRRHEINFSKQVLMARYYIHESRFAEAGNLLKRAQQIHPYKMPEIADLNGRLQLRSGQPKLALPFYKDYLAYDPNNPATMYTIARIYVQTGNAPEAWKWLEMAMAKGFRYSWVLKFDTVWDSYRKQAKWTDLQKRFAAKQYADKDI